jgi:hypothetical protein
MREYSNMRRVATLLSAAVILAFVAGVYAQGKPNFTGKWAMDTEKTAAANTAPAGGGGGGGGRGGGGGGGRGGAGGGDMTITMDAATMKIERAAMGGGTAPAPTVYKLDGSESKNMAGRAGQETEQVSTAKWDGAKLVITTKNPNGDRTTTYYMDGAWLVSEASQNNRKTYYKKGS